MRASKNASHILQLAMALIALYLAVFVVRGVLFARTYPQVHDAAIMRYVVFMIDRGHAPYAWMVEMNPPGTLMTEWFSRHVFGDGAAGLWRWDTAIGLVAVAAAAWIAGAGYRFAGVCGALLAWLLHQADGARDFAQRDWFLAATLLVAAGCAAECLRRRRPVWIAPAMCLSAWATAIKPYAILFAGAAFLIVLIRWRGRRRSIVGWSAVGITPPLLAVALYFAHWPGSFAAFLQTEHTLGAWYARLDEAPLVSMITQVLPLAVFVVFFTTLYLWFREMAWTSTNVGAPPSPGSLRLRWDSPNRHGDLLLLAGFVCSAAMYLLQRKGFMYQTYPMDLFGLVGGFVVAQRSLGGARDQRLLAVVLLMTALCGLPYSLAQKQRTGIYAAESQHALENDLEKLGGSNLNGHVQCLDMTMGGCIGALAELHLEQSTGFVNDHTLFPQEPKPFLHALQQRLLREVAARPPRVIVLSAHNWPDEEDRTFSKPERWPEFAEFLASHYNLHNKFQPAAGSRAAAYRIYVLRPSA